MDDLLRTVLTVAVGVIFGAGATLGGSYIGVATRLAVLEERLKRLEAELRGALGELRDEITRLKEMGR